MPQKCSTDALCFRLTKMSPKDAIWNNVQKPSLQTFNLSWREEDLKNCAYLWKNLASPPDYGVSIC